MARPKIKKPLTTQDFDTIAAVSTPPGEGGISIVRMSGKDAFKIIDKIYRGKDLDKVPTDTINYGHIVDPQKHNQEVDEVMVSIMRSPRTYTRENIVEINCHGGLLVTNRILQIVLSNGARMAKPGEFTERAFLNGRIDLSQSEAVMDIIEAKTDQSNRAAQNQLDGKLSRMVKELRHQILKTLANVEVNIDYPEYDEAEVMTTKIIKKRSLHVRKAIRYLLETARTGTILRNGLATAIVGRPNVGKSSILNRLLHQKKAIVTNIPGTTRDSLEEYVNVRGVPLKLIDTAGIRNAKNQIERIGVKRSERAIKQADLVLLVLNASEKLTPEDKKLLKMTSKSKRIVILNKTDLPVKIEVNQIKKVVGAKNVISTAAIKLNGTDALEKKIANLFFKQGIQSTQNDVMVTNARQESLLRKANGALNDVLKGVKAGMPVDLVQIDLKRCWKFLGEITGDTYNGELLDQLFSQFCVGK
ncbi:MAG: tRNA uridine-5-carboxymethylaminomethyl(34) synthesis GTPase MnmE [Acetilactobacillus jinshanensis]